MRRIGFMLAGLGLLACRPAVHRAFPPDAAPAEFAPAIALGDSATRLLQQRLGQRLLAELAAGGPIAAVAVCRDEAPGLTSGVARELALELGRTSHRLRNPRNAPRDWVRPYLAAAAGRRAAEVAPVAVDLGDRVGLLRPIPTGTVCLGCHGPAESLDPALREALRSAYPDDRAVGFAEGEFRGFFWAEVPLSR